MEEWISHSVYRVLTVHSFMAIKYKPSKEINVLGRKNLMEDYELSKQHCKAGPKMKLLKDLYKMA